MVKYGYAETVDKMIERLAYDILYYENMSLALDITILIYIFLSVSISKSSFGKTYFLKTIIS